MLEFCGKSHRKFQYLSANNGGSRGSRPHGTATPGWLPRVLALGFYAPAAPRFKRSAAVFSAACPILGRTATGVPDARPQREQRSRTKKSRGRWGGGTLGYAAPVSGSIARSTEPEARLSSHSPAADSRPKGKRCEISTYEIIRLKLALESTLTEERYGGTVGWSLSSPNAHRVNAFRMISLRKRGGAPLH